MNNNDDFKQQHLTIKWVPVTLGTPSKAVLKVLTKAADGFVEEGIYNRRNNTWARPDGTRLDGVTHWSLTSDSIPGRQATI